MLRLAASVDEQTQAAQSVAMALNGGDGRAAVAIFQKFPIPERLIIGVQAIELGADTDSVNLAIKSAAVTPVETKQTEDAIQMAPEYVRRALTPWWKSTAFKLAVGSVLAIIAWRQFNKKKTIASIS